MLLKGTFRAFSTFVFGEIDALPPCVDAIRLDLPRTETADEDPEMALLMGVHLVQASQKLQDHSSLYVYEHKQSLRLMPHRAGLKVATQLVTEFTAYTNQRQSMECQPSSRPVNVDTQSPMNEIVNIC